MNDQEILETGELCEALLTSSKFGTIVAQFEQTLAADILGTKPNETKKREDLYHGLWGVRGLLEYMKLNASAAAHLKAPKEPLDATTDPVDYDFDEPRGDEENDY